MTMLGTTKSRDPVERGKEGLCGGSCPVWLGIEEDGRERQEREQQVRAGASLGPVPLPASIWRGKVGHEGGEVQTSSPANVRSSCQEWGELWLCLNQEQGSPADRATLQPRTYPIHFRS